MGAVAAAFAEFFGTAGAGTAAGTAAGSAAGAAGVAGAAGAAGAGAGAGLGASLAATAVKAGTIALATGLVTKALAPGAPDIKAPAPMPDPLGQEAARKKSVIEQMARRGRSASILTEPGGNGTLGGG